MFIGVPRERKEQEYRVALVPSAVKELVLRGHTVLVEEGAGEGIGASDAAFAHAGASIAADADTLYAKADLIVKVKEPQADERAFLRSGQMLFAYLHLAADPAQARDLLKSDAICIAFETVTSPSGRLPLLTPMSEIAGRLAVQAGAYWLQRANGGSGVLLSGAPGVAPAKVMILGGGVVGANAIAIAVGMGADVVVLDRVPDVLRALSKEFGSRIKTEFSTSDSIRMHIADADLVIGGVLVTGAAAPKLITMADLGSMRPGSVFVDVSIDQGGCAETSRPTTHSQPTFVENGVVHYCVANMPGAVPRTSAAALSNAILPYVLVLADYGWRRALLRDAHLMNGLNVCKGQITHSAVAEALRMPSYDPRACLEAA